MKITLLIDFGSTFTKITAVDLSAESVVGKAQAPSTVGTNVMEGLQQAIRQLADQLGMSVGSLDIERALACSSAAGGLKMVTVGLVPDLTAEAGKRAALGAGAKVQDVFAFEISSSEVERIQNLAPDIILLTGGTDGGNKDVIIKNARALAKAGLSCPIIVAGNKSAQDDIVSVFTTAGIPFRVTGNVMPEIGVLNVDSARVAIREVFMERIVKAKGLAQAQNFLQSVIIPTPMAVLEAGMLLAEGYGTETGIGDLMIADVGGATTDIHSVGQGLPVDNFTYLRGLPEPYAKRTVEGDLGIRYNARTIVEVVGISRLLAEMDGHEPPVEAIAQEFATEVNKIPQTEAEIQVEKALAKLAVNVACQRHAGTLKSVQTPQGERYFLYGKDLSAVPNVIGTGGIFAYGRYPRSILSGLLYDERNPTSLKPKSPKMLIDERYILYAVGLLKQIAPEKALRIAKKTLRKV